MAGSRSPIRSFSLRSVPRTYRRPSLPPPPPPASQHQLRASNLALSRSLGGREYNMTDGHSRTNTVGHRTVRGQRMPTPTLPAVRCVPARRVRVRLASFPVACSVDAGARENHLRHPRFDSGLCEPLRAASLRVSTLADSPDLCGGVLSSSLFLALSPSPPARAVTRNTTQAAPEAGNETHVWHYFRSGQSGRSGADRARHLSAVASNQQTERATLRRVRTWPLRSVASPAIARNNSQFLNFLTKYLTIS